MIQWGISAKGTMLQGEGFGEKSDGKQTTNTSYRRPDAVKSMSVFSSIGWRRGGGQV